MQRKVTGGSVSFRKNWAAYRDGFGSATDNDNYWLGLEKIYRFLQFGNLRLRIEACSYSPPVLISWAYGLVPGTWTELNWTPVRELQCEQPHCNTRVQNWPSINRPSFTASDQDVTLTTARDQWTHRERSVMQLGGIVECQFSVSSVQFMCYEQTSGRVRRRPVRATSLDVLPVLRRQDETNPRQHLGGTAVIRLCRWRHICTWARAARRHCMPQLGRSSHAALGLAINGAWEYPLQATDARDYFSQLD